jgi:hypothetical protein
MAKRHLQLIRENVIVPPQFKQKLWDLIDEALALDLDQVASLTSSP